MLKKTSLICCASNREFWRHERCSWTNIFVLFKPQIINYKCFLECRSSLSHPKRGAFDSKTQIIRWCSLKHSIEISWRSIEISFLRYGPLAQIGVDRTLIQGHILLGKNQSKPITESAEHAFLKKKPLKHWTLTVKCVIESLSESLSTACVSSAGAVLCVTRDLLMEVLSGCFHNA